MVGAVVTWPFRLLLRHPRPTRYQQLYVRTHDLVRAGSLLTGPPQRNRFERILGKVVAPGDWDLHHKDLEMTWKRKTLFGLAAGLGPQGSGYVERMEAMVARYGVNHGCRDYASITKRATLLETTIEQIKTDGRLRERSEVVSWAFRELGGIEVAIGRDGTVYREGDGGHRFVFATALDIEAVPVAVIAIHPDAIRNGAYRHLLSESRRLRGVMLS